jgi:site-specific recombinase XerD
MTLNDLSTALTTSSTTISASLAPDLGKAVELARQEKAANTRRGYGSAFANFERWCKDRDVSSLPAAPETVVAYLAKMAERVRANTIGHRVAAIRYAHLISGHPSPTDSECVRAVVRGIRRSLGTAPRKKLPALAERVIAMTIGTGSGLKGLRDRALLLLGFAAACRRSELVALDWSDIEECDAGLRITIHRSKGDQEGNGVTIGVVKGSTACPVAALRAWREAAGVVSGPVFRSVRKGGRLGERLSDQSVSDIVKAHAEHAGLDPSLFAAHSLRSGFITSAAMRGASLWKLLDQSRHRSVETLKGYVRDVEIFKEHAGAGLL